MKTPTGYYNQLHEWVWDENSKNDDGKYYLRLNKGDLTPLCYVDFLNNVKHLYLPWFPENFFASMAIERMIENQFVSFFDLDLLNNEICFTSCENILPTWQVPEDNAILFLNAEDQERYYKKENVLKEFVKKKDGSYPYFGYLNHAMDRVPYRKISVIIQNLHSKNIQEINDLGRKLKKEHGIKEFNVYASHCFVDLTKIYGTKPFHTFASAIDKDNWLLTDINKITTTDSTGVLEPQKSERLEVIDCRKFFK